MPCPLNGLPYFQHPVGYTDVAKTDHTQLSVCPEVKCISIPGRYFSFPIQQTLKILHVMINTGNAQVATIMFKIVILLLQRSLLGPTQLKWLPCFCDK